MIVFLTILDDYGVNLSSVKAYKIGQASKMLGVHPNTLRKWRKEGKIKAVRVGRVLPCACA